jgi:hypothetical protein
MPADYELRIDVISVGAAFQPRLNDYGFRATSFFTNLYIATIYQTA